MREAHLALFEEARILEVTDDPEEQLVHDFHRNALHTYLILSTRGSR